MNRAQLDSLPAAARREALDRRERIRGIVSDSLRLAKKRVSPPPQTSKGKEAHEQPKD